MSKVSYRFLTPNYKPIANSINKLHDTKYTDRQIKYIHSGKHDRTENGLKEEIESFVGLFENWFDGKLKRYKQFVKDNDIDLKYLTPNYKSISVEVNNLHGTNYTYKYVKQVHKKNNHKTVHTVRSEVEQMIGKYQTWFDGTTKIYKGV